MKIDVISLIENAMNSFMENYLLWRWFVNFVWKWCDVLWYASHNKVDTIYEFIVNMLWIEIRLYE